MTKRWAVGYYSLFTNELSVEIISADTFHEAVRLHSKAKEHFGGVTMLNDPEQLKNAFFNTDAGIDWVEIP